jgi:hypothetical protein
MAILHWFVLSEGYILIDATAKNGYDWQCSGAKDMTRAKSLLSGTLVAFMLGLLGASALATGQTMAAGDSHSHDFDFEFGSWKADLRLLAHRLVGSHEWIDYHGTLVVHPLFYGKGNMSDLEVSNATSSIHGGALHLYNPDTHEWSVWFANAGNGTLGVPGVGRFENGRGVLYDHEVYHGRQIYVRQAFSDISAHAFHYEQAFSIDDGKTWETNLIINYTR